LRRADSPSKEPYGLYVGLRNFKRAVERIIIIQFNSIYLCAKLNSPEANYKVSIGKKMGRVRSKKASENNVLIKIKIIKYKMAMSALLLS
jgi:hypothetical protein